MASQQRHRDDRHNTALSTNNYYLSILIYDARLFVPEFTFFAARKMFYNEPQLYLSRVGLDRSFYRSHEVEQYRDSKHRYNGFHPDLSSLCSERDAITERHHEELAESLVQYTGIFDEQQHIYDGGQDLQSLRAGIEKLPKLTKVSISNFKRYDTVPPKDKHRWYQDQARKEFECAVEPLWYCQERGNYDEVDCYPWDCRGLQNLILAISKER
ncbi:hypothetical protein OEA41_004247 [Lepraria neglecta]|uniref:Uncharacterized protein n=1 Tax=Lepraria neglecta TaxID=209136 RepID=A0AAE0DFK9_9LECA|nr:hypothetical protein OEA41_004247 [Lepraria neglecta]